VGYVSSLEGILLIPLSGYRKHSALLGPVRASDFRLTKSKIAEAFNGNSNTMWRFFMEKSGSFTDVPGVLGLEFVQLVVARTV